MRRTSLATLISLAALAATSATASADLPQQSFYIGPYAGVTLSLDGDWDLHKIADARISPELATPTFGVRIGGTIGYWISIEGSVSLLLPQSELGGGNTAFAYSLDVLGNLLPSGDWVPFLSVGAGGYHNVSGELGEDLDYRFGAGIGVRGLLTDWVILRADAKWVVTDGSEGTHFANNLEVLVGVDFLLWQSSGENNDWDGDGILNPDDKCPRVPGHPSAQGCPDRDGDTVVDDKDKCPDTPGLVALEGCPDHDGDGIIDSKDKCPDTPGPVEHQGCPDSDGDGIIDLDDRCPQKPGPLEYKGCPDRDGDKIPDIDDRCPDVPGIPQLQGCPEDKPMVLEGVNFDYNRASLLPQSREILDKVAQTLKDYPTMRVKIVGHTDSDGPDDFNLRLSLRRANTVRDYLVSSHGIARDRMEVAGRGEKEPIAPNGTPEGRAKNRRIAFELLSK